MGLEQQNINCKESLGQSLCNYIAYDLAFLATTLFYMLNVTFQVNTSIEHCMKRQ